MRDHLTFTQKNQISLNLSTAENSPSCLGNLLGRVYLLKNLIYHNPRSGTFLSNLRYSKMMINLWGMHLWWDDKLLPDIYVVPFKNDPSISIWTLAVRQLS